VSALCPQIEWRSRTKKAAPQGGRRTVGKCARSLRLGAGITVCGSARLSRTAAHRAAMSAASLRFAAAAAEAVDEWEAIEKARRMFLVQPSKLIAAEPE
jgi:hypothetical protein